MKKIKVTDETTLSDIARDHRKFPEEWKYKESVYEVRIKRQERMLNSTVFKKLLKTLYECYGTSECDTFLSKADDSLFDVLWEKYLGGIK